MMKESLGSDQTLIQDIKRIKLGFNAKQQRPDAELIAEEEEVFEFRDELKFEIRLGNRVNGPQFFQMFRSRDAPYVSYSP